jgi:hypothetical protein
VISALRKFNIEALGLVVSPVRINEAVPVCDVIKISGLCQTFRMSRKCDRCHGSSKRLRARGCVGVDPLLNLNLDCPGHLELVRVL